MSEIKEPIQIYENKIKFKVWSFFGNPQDVPAIKLMSEIQKIIPKNDEDWGIRIKLKRIREALLKEAQICEQVIQELLEQFCVKDADGKPLKDGKAFNGYVMPEDSEQIKEFNRKYLDFINSDIELPFEQIKSTDIFPPKTLQQLDVLEGIIEIVDA